MNIRVFRTIALVLVMSLVTTTAAFAAVPSDVQGQPYEKAVEVLMDKGVITGDIDGLFHSNDNLTRAQACVIVVKALNVPSAEVVGTPTQKSPTSGFADMSGYGWADGYVAYAIKNGITKGVGNNKFAPQAKVKSEEMVTMLLRAAGYKDESLQGTWPTNYMNKAEELNLFNELGEISKLANPATKAVAAQLTYNIIDSIEAAQLGNANTGDNEFVPGSTKMTFGTGSFNDTMTTYAGKTISKNVVVYTYDKQVNYKSDMQLPTNKSEYTLDTINKFKNAKTPCFYKVKDGKIIAMVLPMDAGFSGRVYGVINSISSVVNGDDEKVKSIETLAAGREVSWMTKKDNIKGLPASNNEYFMGDIYEIITDNGIVKEMYKVGEVGHHKDFTELTESDFTDVVESYSDHVVKLKSGGDIFEVAENASVYVLSEDGEEYKVGSLSNIRKDMKIRAYDISKDETIASIIVVQKQ